MPDKIQIDDDNPAERELVRQQLPMVAVPEISASNVSGYIPALEQGRYFETVGITADDLVEANSLRAREQQIVSEARSAFRASVVVVNGEIKFQ